VIDDRVIHRVIDDCGIEAFNLAISCAIAKSNGPMRQFPDRQ
jgi:hypothetical protein